MAPFNEQLPAHLDAKPAIARHDEVVAECPKEQVEDVADLLEEIMVDGMDEIINPRLSANHPERLSHSAGCAVCFYSREEVTLG
jgi:hypothetical protein